MKIVLIVVLLVLFSFCLCVRGGGQQDVRDLDSDNFYEAVYTKDSYWLLEFYAPWCGHCKKLAPIYEDVGRELAKEGEVSVGKIDCEANSEICTLFGVGGYPAIKLVKSGQVYTFNHVRDVEHIISFAKNAHSDPNTAVDVLPERASVTSEEAYSGTSFVVSVGFANFTQITTSKTQGFLIEFYSPENPDCTQFSPIFNKLSYTVQSSNIGAGAVNCDVEKVLCQEFFVTSVPQIIYTFGTDYWVFTGENRAAPILRFLKDHKTIGSQKLPRLYGAFHDEMQILLLYFSAVEVTLKDNVWIFIFGSFFYGLTIGWYIFRSTQPTQQTNYYTNQQHNITKSIKPTTNNNNKSADRNEAKVNNNSNKTKSTKSTNSNNNNNKLKNQQHKN